MNRRVVDARLDPSLFQRRPDSIPIDPFWQYDHGQMVRRDPPAVAVSKRHRQPLNAVQGLAVEAGDPRPGLVLLDQARKLDEPNRCADLVEPIVEPGKNDVIAGGVAPVAVPGERGHSVRPQKPQLFRQLLVAGDDHPALPDRKVLVGEEAEAPNLAERAAHAAIEARARRVRSVLYDRKPMPVGDLGDCVHRTWKAGVVQGDHCLRSRCDGGGDVLRVEVELVGTDDVTEDRLCPGVDDRVRGGDEVERRDDDLVSRLATHCEQGQMERGGPVGDRDRVRSAAKGRELALELLHPRAHAPPARADGLEHRIGELVVDTDVRERHAPAQLAGLCHVGRCRTLRADTDEVEQLPGTVGERVLLEDPLARPAAQLSRGSWIIE